MFKCIYHFLRKIMATVQALISQTVPQEFPPGTVGGQFKFTLTKLADNTSISQETTEVFSVFTDVAPGDYTMSALLLDANGVEISLAVTANFNVPEPVVILQVPTAVQVNLI
jgi:hypothetical protein